MIMSPQYLYALLLVIPYVIIMKQYKNNLSRMRTAEPALHYARRITLFGLMSIIVLVLGLSEPVVPSVKKSVIVHHASVTIVLDVSNSMTMKGVNNNALADAKLFITDLLQTVHNTQGAGLLYSLIVFKGKAVVLVPAVQNPAYIADALSWVQPASITGAGSALGDALALAKTTVQNPQNSIIVICTDGTSKPAEKELMDLYVMGAEICIVGFGSQPASPIYNSEGNTIKDYNGSTILLARNRSNMMFMAKRAHAHYFDYEDGAGLDFAAKKIISLKKANGLPLVREKPMLLTPILAFIAFCFLALANITYLILHKKLAGYV